MALMTEYRPPKVTYKSCSFGDWMIATACGGHPGRWVGNFEAQFRFRNPAPAVYYGAQRVLLWADSQKATFSRNLFSYRSGATAFRLQN